MVKRGLEPAHPIAVTLAASLEAIDTLSGAKWGSPRIMPDETKLALTHCASRGPVSTVTFEAVSHCSLPWSVRPSFACRLRRSLQAPQLSAGRDRASKWGTKPIRRLTMLGRGPKVANRDPGAPPAGQSPDEKSWRPRFASIVGISQSLRGPGTASVAFLTQINRSYAELWYCSPAPRVLRVAIEA